MQQEPGGGDHSVLIQRALALVSPVGRTSNKAYLEVREDELDTGVEDLGVGMQLGNQRIVIHNLRMGALSSRWE